MICRAFILNTTLCIVYLLFICDNFMNWFLSYLCLLIPYVCPSSIYMDDAAWNIALSGAVCRYELDMFQQ